MPEPSVVQIDYVVCDVFAEHALAGNQLAVFSDGTDIPDRLRAALAREMNYSESVFVTPTEEGADAAIWIYTPTRELRFAGHPVLGTAAVLANATDRNLVLRTRAAPVAIEVRAAGAARADVSMEQPWPEIVATDEDVIRTALGAGRDVEIVGYDNGMRFALVDLSGREAVASLKPDLGALARLPYGVLCFGGEGLRWKARMFAPGVGVAEDPATGSAAGPLAVHLHSAGRVASGSMIDIEQGVEIGRPSLLHAQVSGDGDRLRIRVGGHVVIVARGAFSLRPELLELESDRAR